MILTVISFKGGVGKSTISQNLAVALAKLGHELCIIDADKNQSSSTWASFREEELITIPVYHVADQRTITNNIDNLAKKYEIVIIDCPPAIEAITSKAVAKSDFSLIPVATTGGGDIWATEKFLEHIDLLRTRLNANFPIYFVVNRYEKNVNMHKAYLEALEKYQEAYEVGMLETLIAKRNAYGEANANGRSVLEWDNKKAKNEINALAKEVLEIANQLFNH